MLIDIFCKRDATIIRVLEKRLIASGVPEFKKSIREVIRQKKGPIVIDLTAIELLDSSGLGALIAVLKMVGNPMDLKIVGIRGTVRELFKLTRMDRVFTIFDTVEAALA